MYTKQTIEHFRNPHNYGVIKNPDGQGEAGNIICGDIMTLYIIVKKGIIQDIKFKTYGCAAAIATSSVITDLVKGKTIEQALKISKKDIVNTLNGLPTIKIHCSLLAIDALGEAIYQYLMKNKKPIPENLHFQHERIEKEKRAIEERLKRLKKS